MTSSSCKAMILAAGRGQRLRPLTDVLPKPLIDVCGKPLIVWQIEALAKAGYNEIVINAAWLAGKLKERLGHGEDYGVRIHWSIEKPVALETAGGIAHARRYFADAPILIVSADVYTGFDYRSLTARRDAIQLSPTPRAHLVMVPNPDYHPQGDFHFADNRLYPQQQAPLHSERLTFGNIGLYSPQLFADLDPNQPAKLSPLFCRWINDGIVSAERFDGTWHNIGTLEDIRRCEDR